MGHLNNWHKETPQGLLLVYNTLISNQPMPDDLHKEEQIFLKAFKEYKEHKEELSKDVGDKQPTNTCIPAVIASVL